MHNQLELAVASEKHDKGWDSYFFAGLHKQIISFQARDGICDWSIQAEWKKSLPQTFSTEHWVCNIIIIHTIDQIYWLAKSK